ncbi:hypothetical protein FA13DRAFT_116174 [Coprinellus micaceus]|uniref:Uncharacterized protein n=1 Tax=Coprinellus micaceus TaxID=71717 RepID=A0A4Y7TIQ2_COPMI|nr:hypothetical protein FA13DRAFT_116174 [Coprinellus micaceus]
MSGVGHPRILHHPVKGRRGDHLLMKYQRGAQDFEPGIHTEPPAFIQPAGLLLDTPHHPARIPSTPFLRQGLQVPIRPDMDRRRLGSLTIYSYRTTDKLAAKRTPFPPKLLRRATVDTQLELESAISSDVGPKASVGRFPECTLPLEWRWRCRPGLGDPDIIASCVYSYVRSEQAPFFSCSGVSGLTLE